MTAKTNEVLIEVLQERVRQDAKWGEQNHIPFVWLAILGEEVGEANKEALESWAQHDQGKLGAYRKEMVQVAAVAVAMIESLDRHYAEPVCPGNCGFEHDEVSA